MSLSDLDKQLVENYAQTITEPIKHGENAVLCWFPGAGMTTICKDLLNTTTLLKTYLGKLTEVLEIRQVWAHLSLIKTMQGLIQELGFASPNDMKADCNQLLKDGYEVVYFVARIDDYPEDEKTKILKLFIQLNSLNPRRVHIIFNTFDKPWFTKILSSHSEMMTLANRLEVVPLLSNKLLKKYITTRAKDYDYKINQEKIDYLQKTYGGILQLTKEYLRLNGKTKMLELKFRVLWDALPDSYRNHIEALINDDHQGQIASAQDDLESFGASKLNVFENHKRVLNLNPQKALKKLLTPSEMSLWQYCQKQSGKLIPKDTALDLLRPETNDDISLWAMDKAISRFRKKLAKAGVDPELFTTVRGKGYIWTGT